MKIGWWNTGLSPPKRGVAERVAQAGHSSTLKRLAEQGASLIGLCEVSAEQLKRLEMTLGSFESRWGRVSCPARNLGLVFNREQWSVRQEMSLTFKAHGQSGHAGWILRCKSRGRGPLRLVLLHWRTSAHHGGFVREGCARQLRDAIEADPTTPTIVIGDFNCEPFDEHVTRYLGGTRDRQMVVDRRAPFFNPFWSAGSDAERPVWSSLRLSRPDPVQLSSWMLVDFGLVNAPLLASRVSGEVLAEGEMTSDHWPVMLTLQSPLEARE